MSPDVVGQREWNSYSEYEEFSRLSPTNSGGGRRNIATVEQLDDNSLKIPHLF